MRFSYKLYGSRVLSQDLSCWLYSRLIKIYCDNNSMVRFSYSMKNTNICRYIVVKYLVLHERIKDIVYIRYINAELLIIDPLTKVLILGILRDHVDHMGHSSFYDWCGLDTVYIIIILDFIIKFNLFYFILISYLLYDIKKTKE